MVRDGEIETEQANDGADQPFGLPQSQAEHDAQRQRRRNRQGRIVWLTAPRGPWFGAPGRDRLFAEPDRQTATLAQASIIFRPVRYPILLPGDVMTAIGIDLERHGRTSQEDYGWGSVLPSGTAQPDLPLAEVYGPVVILTNHREVPLSERRMVLYTYSAPDVSPADPCNKMPSRCTGVAERLVVPLKPGNAGGGKGPQFKTDARRGEGPGDWATYQLRRVFRNCRRRCTRKRRQKPAIT